MRSVLHPGAVRLRSAVRLGAAEMKRCAWGKAKAGVAKAAANAPVCAKKKRSLPGVTTSLLIRV